LGLPVDVVVAEDYPALIQAQVSGRVQYAIYSTTAYATAALSCACVVPLVAPTSGNGALGLRAVLVTRATGFTDIEQIASYRVAFSGVHDLAGLALPRAELVVAGRPMTGTEPFLVDAASPAAALEMLRGGKVDALFGWVETGLSKTPLPGAGTLANLAQLGVAEADFRIVWTSSLLRYGPHAIRSDIDPEVRRRLVPFLIGLRDSDAEVFDTLETHHLGGFSAVDANDYANAVDLVRNLSK
jgi:phosphonate transport system substrate-binding protein